jgi:hypothetical protein
MLLQFSHRFNLEHTLESSNQKAKTVISLHFLFLNGTFGLFLRPKWVWVVEQGTFSSMLAPSLSIIQVNKFRSFSECHPLQETMLLPTTLQPWHSFSVYLPPSFTMLIQLHCLSHSFQQARI